MDLSSVPFKKISLADHDRIASDLITLLTGKFSGYISLQSVTFTVPKNYENCPELSEVNLHSSHLNEEMVRRGIDVISKDVVARFNKSFSQFCNTNSITEEEIKAFPNFVPGVSQQKHALTVRKLNAMRGLPFDIVTPPEEESEEILYSPVRGFAKLDSEYVIPYDHKVKEGVLTFLFRGVKVNIIRSASTPSYRINYFSFGNFGQYISKMLAFFGVQMNQVNAYIQLSNSEGIELAEWDKIVVFREMHEICQFLGMDLASLNSIRFKSDAIKVLTSSRLFCLEMFEDLPESDDFNHISFNQIKEQVTTTSPITTFISRMPFEKRVAMVQHFCGIKESLREYASAISKQKYINILASQEKVQDILTTELSQVDKSLVREVVKNIVISVQLMSPGEVKELTPEKIKEKILDMYARVLAKKNTASTEYLGTI